MTTETIYDTPRVKHVMRGAEGPDTPDSQRRREDVIKDHAIRTWGELRDVAVLDSAKATAILEEGMRRLLGSVFDDSEKYKKQVEEAKRNASRLLGRLRSIATRPPNGSEVRQQGHLRRCVCCNQGINAHNPKCAIQVATEMGIAMGFTVGVPE